MKDCAWESLHPASVKFLFTYSKDAGMSDRVGSNLSGTEDGPNGPRQRRPEVGCIQTDIDIADSHFHWEVSMSSKIQALNCPSYKVLLKNIYYLSIVF